MNSWYKYVRTPNSYRIEHEQNMSHFCLGLTLCYHGRCNTVLPRPSHGSPQSWPDRIISNSLDSRHYSDRRAGALSEKVWDRLTEALSGIWSSPCFNFKPFCLVKSLIGLEMQEEIPLAMFEADRQSLPKVRRGANGKLFWLCGGSAERRVQERQPLKVIWLPKENLLRRLLQRVWGPPGGAKRSVPLSCICT